MADFGRIPGVLHHGATAAIGRAVTMQATRTRQTMGTGDPAVTSAEMMKDFVQAVRERIAALIALFGQISPFDDFLLGAREEIKPLNASAESDLDQIRGVEQHMARANSDSELGIFSVARIREQAMKALRGQDPQPERVLSLLKDP